MSATRFFLIQSYSVEMYYGKIGFSMNLLIGSDTLLTYFYLWTYFVHRYEKLVRISSPTWAELSRIPELYTCIYYCLHISLALFGFILYSPLLELFV